MLSEKPWKLEALVRLALSIFLCLGGTALVLKWVQHWGGIGLVDSPWRAVVAALSFQGAALVFVHVFLREHQMNWPEAFGFRNNWPRAVLIGALATLAFLPVGWGLQWTISELLTHFNVQPEEQQAVEALRQAKGWLESAAMALVAVVLAPVAEEIIFRGILYPAIKQLGFPRLALWSTSLLFAAIHMSFPIFLPLLLLALLLTLLYEKTDNLLAPIAAHAFFNALNFAMFYFADAAVQPLPPPQ